MTISMAGIVELCEHGRRYCFPCKTVVIPDLISPEQWSEAHRRILKMKDKSDKKPKGEVGPE